MFCTNLQGRDGASWLSQVMQCVEQQPSQPNTSSNVEKVEHGSSLAILPTSWLPFKKRKLSLPFALEEPINNVLAAAAVPKSEIAQSSSPQSSPEGKTYLPEQRGSPAGIAKKNQSNQDDIKVITFFNCKGM